ncbi:MAG: hypothetical protein AAF280_05530 [Pseudomonadota bacterium]
MTLTLVKIVSLSSLIAVGLICSDAEASCARSARDQSQPNAMTAPVSPALPGQTYG